MQCKARNRPCSFYKDGTLEVEGINKPETPTIPAELIFSINNTSTTKNDTSYTDTDINTEDTILFSETTHLTNRSKIKRNPPPIESRVSNTLNSLRESVRKRSTENSLGIGLFNSNTKYANFIKWIPDAPLPTRYNGSIEMPSRKIQLALIDKFYTDTYESICVIPKHYFYDQLEKKGSLITPLLLNGIYAHAARYTDIPNCPSSDIFYQRAKRLVDDFLDVPRVSTVAALLILSMYEISASVYRPGLQQCRQWIYSGMAFRMCTELGLHNDTNVSNDLSGEDVEIRRLLCWMCYDMDKYHSAGWERPLMLTRSMIKTKKPSLLLAKSKDEEDIIELFNSRLLLSERVDEMLSYHQSILDTFPTDYHDHLSLFLSYLDEWILSIPDKFSWTPPHNTPIENICHLPPVRSMVGHLHMYFHSTKLRVLSNLPTTPTLINQIQLSSACITQLSYIVCKKPSNIVKFDPIVHFLIQAVDVYLRFLDDPDTNVAQQNWKLFDRCMWCLQRIQTYTNIPNCNKFLQQVQQIYGQDKFTKNRRLERKDSKSSLSNVINNSAPHPDIEVDPIHNHNKLITPTPAYTAPTPIAGQLEEQSELSYTYNLFHNQYDQPPKQYPTEPYIPSYSSNQILWSTTPPAHSNLNMTYYPDEDKDTPLSTEINPFAHLLHMPPKLLPMNEHSHSSIPINSSDMPLNSHEQVEDYCPSSMMYVDHKMTPALYTSTTSDWSKLPDPGKHESTSYSKGLGVYMSSRQHYENMIRYPP
ncbi:fungal-specific transcription factor domain-containing protein [Pilobolus umbonatus]|nr:fungal-specific transcription factor domain-containing protein [Pilobolus umbonatus]